MSLADAINARTRRPTIVATLDGRTWVGALTANVSQEYGQGIGSMQITGWAPPSTPQAGMSISVRAGYNGFVVPLFTGYVVTPEQQSYPNRWSLQCSDALWPAARESQPIAVSPLNNVTARQAIEYILATYAGITRMAIPDIARPSGGGDWVLGQLTPVSWSGNVTALAACQEIAQAAGYWLYADAGGTVRARQLERNPSDSPFRVLRGGDAAGATLLVNGSPTRRQPADQVKNRITVRGASTGVEGAQLYDTFLATHALIPGVVNTFDYQSFLLEYIDDVTAVAERIAGVWNRVPNIIPLRIKADPRLSVGTTVAIEDARIGYATAKPFFIYRLNTSIDLTKGKFDQDITLDGGLGDAGFSTVPPPVAVASYTLETETIDGDAIALVRLDGSGSYSQSAGEIVSYAWSTSSTPYAGSPSSASGITATFLFAISESPVSITLVVTDTTSKTDTLDLSIDLAGGGVTVPITEALIVAGGAAVEATSNGGASWGEYIATVTNVPIVGASVWAAAPPTDSASYGALFSGGAVLYQTLDGLATTPTTRYTAGGSITAVHVNARNAARVWIAVGSVVYRSINGGATFTAWGSPGATVRDIIEDPALDDSVFCLAGADMWQSFGPGAPGWLVFYAGPTGATARWFVRSDDGTITWIAYTGTFTGSPLQRVEGPISVTFPVLSPTVDEIRTLALLDAIDPASPALVVSDQENRIFVIDGLTGGNVVQSGATYPSGATVQHALASRKSPLVYFADFDSVTSGTGAVQKYIIEADTLLNFHPLASGRQAHQLGLIALTRTVDVTLIRLPTGASGAADKIFFFINNAWIGKTPPESGRSDWKSIQASPLNANELLLFRWNGGDNALWYSDDFGDTWQNIFTDLSYRSDQSVPVPQWSWSVGGGWALTAHTNDPDFGNNEDRLLRGNRTTYSIVDDRISDPVFNRYGIGAGQSDELAMINVNSAFYVISAANVFSSAVGGSAGFGYFERATNRRMAMANVAAVGAGIYQSSDYRSTAWAAISGAAGNWVAALSDGSTLFVGGRNSGGRSGLQQIAAAFGAAVVTTVAETGVNVGHIRSDRQSQTSVAAVLNTTADNLDTVARDVTTGAWARLPQPAAATSLVDWVEVVVRTT